MRLFPSAITLACGSSITSAITSAAAIATLTLSGCSSLPNVQGPLDAFDQGARAVNTAQMTFLNNVHDMECEQQFYRRAFAYAQDPNTALDLHATCQAATLFLTSAQIQTRQHLLDAIALYATQLNALGSRETDVDLDSELEADAAQLNRLAASGALSLGVAPNSVSNGGLGSGPSSGGSSGLANGSITAGVEAAVISLTNMVLDQARSRDIRQAAAVHQADLAVVIKTLKDENIAIASALDDNLREMRANLATTLAYTRQTQGSAVFFDALRARKYLREIARFARSTNDDSTASKDPSRPSPRDPDLNTGNAVVQLNQALDSLLAANQAIATSGNGDIAIAVRDLMYRARDAYTIQVALRQ